MTPNPSKTYPVTGKNFRLLSFPLACPIRLLRAGKWLGEFQTLEMGCQGFSCLVPDQLVAGLRPGITLDCEIDLTSSAHQVASALSIRLRAKATVLSTSSAGQGLSELSCRILSYQLA